MVTQEETKGTDSEPKEKSIWQIAEVRMVMYVIPLAIVFALIGFFLSTR
jgi:hypothetical protein